MLTPEEFFNQSEYRDLAAIRRDEWFQLMRDYAQHIVENPPINRWELGKKSNKYAAKHTSTSKEFAIALIAYAEGCDEVLRCLKDNSMEGK